ncbi:MAG: hypothetical protein QOI53_2999 [Verrucomicrobiota bacterium]|nr:hypothetical protein [Verrucomicrobiota bacterium]
MDPPRCELPAETGALVSQNQLINTTSETYSREYFLNLIGELIMGTILLIVLILLLVGALPTWPYSSGWGYYPIGGLGLLFIILLVLVLMGRI